MNRLVKYIPNTDLRLGYDGLNALSSLQHLGKGEFVAFVNKAQTRVKLCTQNDVVAYYRHAHGKLNPRLIQTLPEYFNGTAINYNPATLRALRTNFPQFFKKSTTAHKEVYAQHYL